MSGFDPRFDAANAGTRDGVVPAPGAIDGPSNFLRADRTWAIPRGLPPGPQPPAPGPGLDQWACNIAGYLINEVARVAVKYVVDWLPVSWLGDVVGGITVGLLHVLLPEEALLFGGMDSVIFTWVSTYVSTHVADVAATVLDDVAWAKLHCALYDKIKLTPTDLRVAILAFTGVLGGLVGWTTPAVAAITYFFENLGITDVGNIPIAAFVRNYDCSTCAITGIGPTKPLLQSAFDLTVTDGTHAVTFTDELQITGATVSGTSPDATLAIPELSLTDGTHTVTAVETVSTTSMVVGGSGVSATLKPLTATSSALGIVRPDGATLAVSTGGVLAVLNGQLATINLDQYGAVAANLSNGVTISGLVVGRTYALQSTGPAYIYDNAGDTALSFDVSVDGSTWQEVLDYGITGFLVGPTVITPTWAISAAMTDASHARVVWVATATTVRYRASATVYSEASRTLGWQLLDVVYEGSEILVQHGGAKVGTRPVLDFVDSSTVTATVTDDSANDRVTVSLAATASGGGTVGSVTSVSGTAPVAVATGTTTPVVSVGVFNGHGGSHPTGLVPDPGSADAATNFLRADGSYAVPAGTGGSGTVTSVVGTAPITVATGTTTPLIALTTPLAKNYGGTGIDTSAVAVGDLLVGTAGGAWQLGGIGGGDGISVSLVAGIYTVAATGSGAGGTALTLLNTATVTGTVAAFIDVAPPSSGQSHLYIVLEARGDAAADSANILMRLNSDSGANYNAEAHFGSGGTNTAAESIGGTSLQVGGMPAATATAGRASMTGLWLHDYLGTSWHKNAFATFEMSKLNTSTNTYLGAYGGTWRNTAAITAIRLFPASGNFAIGTKIWVYGMA